MRVAVWLWVNSHNEKCGLSCMRMLLGGGAGHFNQPSLAEEEGQKKVALSAFLPKRGLFTLGVGSVVGSVQVFAMTFADFASGRPIFAASFTKRLISARSTPRCLASISYVPTSWQRLRNHSATLRFSIFGAGCCLVAVCGILATSVAAITQPQCNTAV